MRSWVHIAKFHATGTRPLVRETGFPKNHKYREKTVSNFTNEMDIEINFFAMAMPSAQPHCIEHVLLYSSVEVNLRPTIHMFVPSPQSTQQHLLLFKQINVPYTVFASRKSRSYLSIVACDKSNLFRTEHNNNEEKKLIHILRSVENWFSALGSRRRAICHRIDLYWWWSFHAAFVRN